MRGRVIFAYVVGVLGAAVVTFALTALEVRYSYHHGWAHALRSAAGFAVTFAVLLVSIIAFEHRRSRSRG
jgi:threonine/homoserine/homoserine lactone efflux protein